MANDNIADVFQELSNAFDKLTQERHEKGQEEYGKFTFLGNDIVRMMAEELADTANYCRYQFIKLMLLQNELVKQVGTEGKALSDLGIGSFKGVGKIGWDE